MENRCCAVQPVGFAVVGLGMGRGRARQIKKESEQGHPVHLVGVSDLRADRARETAEELDVPCAQNFREFLDRDDVDVIYVVTETGNHARVGIEALEAGKHVLCTKPLEASMEAGAAMVKAAREHRRRLAVDFDKRHGDATSQKIKQAIETGLLGQILLGDTSLKVLRTDEYFEANGGWRGTWALDGGGAMSNQAIHEIDQLYFFLGMPDSVQASIWTQNHDIEAEDLGVATWYYEGGTVATLRATTCWPVSEWYSRHEIHGSEGALIWSARGNRWYYDGAWQEDLPDYEVNGDSATLQFARAVTGDHTLPCDGEEGLRSLAILKAMYRSAAEGQRVSPRDLLAEHMG